MKNIKRLLAIILMVTLLMTSMVITAAPALAKTKTVKTKKITLSQKGTIKMNKGDTLTLTATLKPANSTQKVKWSSSNKKVATVKNGKVTAKKKGTATITAKSGKKSAKVKIKVVKSGAAPVPETPVVTPAPETPVVVDQPVTEQTHTHTWEDVTTTVEHPEEGHWDVVTTRTPDGVQTSYVEHPAEGHWEEVSSEQMVKEAWDEEVTVVDKEAWWEPLFTCGGCLQVCTTREEAEKHLRVPGYCPASASEVHDYPADSVFVWEGTKGVVTNEILDRWTAEDGTPMVRVKTTGAGVGCYSITTDRLDHPAETHVEVVHHDAEYATITDKVWVEDKAAWTETVETPIVHSKSENVYIVDVPAWTETVVTGQRCTTCGATK